MHGVARVQTIALDIAPELVAPPSLRDLFKDAETFGARSSGIDDPKVCILALVPFQRTTSESCIEFHSLLSQGGRTVFILC